MFLEHQIKDVNHFYQLRHFFLTFLKFLLLFFIVSIVIYLLEI